jgi:hypothetical protein
MKFMHDRNKIIGGVWAGINVIFLCGLVATWYIICGEKACSCCKAVCCFCCKNKDEEDEDRGSGKQKTKGKNKKAKLKGGKGDKKTGKSRRKRSDSTDDSLV